MTAKQKAKHIADKQPIVKISVGTTLTPDGLGLWKGGLPKSSTLLQRKRPTQFASNKNTPGKSSSEVVERSPEYFKAGSPVKHAKVDTRFGYQTDMVKPYVPETTAE